MRRKFAAANWKMNLNLEEAYKLVDHIFDAGLQPAPNHFVLISVPFPYLIPLQERFRGSRNIFLAAQNCASVNNGAYTGEVSASMLKDMGVYFVIIGHSERRMYQGETNELLAEKVNRALENRVYPVFCCGEALEVREAGTQNEFVGQQIKDSLFHLDSTEIQKITIAYEPIWAIGTGKTATTDQAQEMHSYIRSVLAEKYGAEIAETISILYGGSVKASNAAELFSRPDVDGGLVGGASLVADEFLAIIKSLP